MTPTGWIFIYLLLAAVVVFLAIKLSNYVDLLDKKTKLSGALLGGILLAAVTSLPELFTSLTGTLMINDNHLVLGNIMGSDFFDIVIFGVVYLLFFRNLVTKKLGKQHYYTIFFTFAMIVAVTLAAFVFNKQGWLIGGYFNPMSLAIIAIYVVSVWKTPKTEEKEEKETTTSTLTVKQIWILFAVCSALLIGASIGVTYVTDEVVKGFKIDATFGGSLFLGLATSLPEVTATIALCKKKNFDAAFGDIFGSCVFNIIILGIADALSFKAGPLYNIDTSSFLLIVGTAFVLLVSFISVIYIRSSKFENNAKSRVILYAFAVILIASYIAYLVLSNSGLKINF